MACSPLHVHGVYTSQSSERILFWSALFYRAVGFVNNAMAFVAFCGVTIAIQFVGEASGLFCLAIFDDPNIANSVAALYFSLTAMLSAGFLR